MRREVEEEVGVVIGEVDYLGSQPWPFPSSLMLGFVAHAKSVEIDGGDGEIAEARWFTRSGLRADVDRGRVLLSPPVSIARRLIEHWYGEPDHRLRRRLALARSGGALVRPPERPFPTSGDHEASDRLEPGPILHDHERCCVESLCDLSRS